MSLRQQREINELRERVEKLEAAVAVLTPAENGVSRPMRRRPGRPRKEKIDVDNA